MKNHKIFATISLILLMTTFAQVSIFARRQQQTQTSNQGDSIQASPQAQEKLRKLLAEKKTYKVGITSALEHEQPELTGIAIPKNAAQKANLLRKEAQRRMAENALSWERYKKQRPKDRLEPLDPYLKLRKQLAAQNPNKPLPEAAGELAELTSEFSLGSLKIYNQILEKEPGETEPQRNQVCWAYAPIEALEINYANGVRRANSYVNYIETKNGTDEGHGLPYFGDLKFNKEDVVSCSGKGNAQAGGFPGDALNYLMTVGAAKGVTNERFDKPYCQDRRERTKALAWDYVHYPPDQSPSVLEIKRALLEHGALVSLICADKELMAYRGGVFNEKDTGVNHAIVIIGWSDEKKAWWIQNSWGKDWGEDGRGWIAYGSNQIGLYAMWVEAPMDFSGNWNIASVPNFFKFGGDFAVSLSPRSQGGRFSGQ